MLSLSFSIQAMDQCQKQPLSTFILFPSRYKKKSITDWLFLKCIFGNLLDFIFRFCFTFCSRSLTQIYWQILTDINLSYGFVSGSVPYCITKIKSIATKASKLDSAQSFFKSALCFIEFFVSKVLKHTE